jgi:hypothetical protein
MVAASLGLLGQEVERLSVSPSGLFDETSDAAQTEDESTLAVRQQEVEPTAPQVGGPRRKRGFSPVLGAQAEAPTAAPAEPEYDEDGEEIVAPVERSKRRILSPEERAEVLATNVAGVERVPFLRGLPRALQRVREHREAAHGAEEAVATAGGTDEGSLVGSAGAPGIR